MLRLMSVSQQASLSSGHRAVQARCPRPKGKSIKTLSAAVVGVEQN